MSKPAALIRPQSVQFLDALPTWPLRQLPTVRIAETLPEPDEHRARIAAALQRLRDPASGLHKVVLARALRLVADGPLDARTIVDRLVAADPAANAYLVDLTAAGGEYSGTALVGASPELLVARHGDAWCARRSRARRRGCRIRTPTRPAGGAGRVGQEPPRARAGRRRDARGARPVVRRPADPADTAAEQHRRGLAPVHTDHRARLRERSTTALDLAIALHPTPAVGGVPAAASAS